MRKTELLEDQALSTRLKVEAITLREIRMPLVHFFETSFGRTYSRRILLVTVHCDGVDGWAESDRKSTRHSSHSQISYAVFCLQKKKGHRRGSYRDLGGHQALRPCRVTAAARQPAPRRAGDRHLTSGPASW